MLRIAFQMDPLHKLNQAADSTLEIARAAAARGHQMFHYEPNHLRLDVTSLGTKLTATGHALHHKPTETQIWQMGEAQPLDLAQMDVILMRQDPPFDLGYISATHMLEHLPKTVRIINDPAGVRNAPEKLLVTHFPHLMPPTLVTRDRSAIEDFREQHRDIIIKPLYGYAGHGIFHLREGDDNLPALVETLTAQNSEPWMIQKFLPVGDLGDKRIVLVNGEAMGAILRRPLAGDMRGNMRVGGQAHAVELSIRDEEICAALAPVLRKRGLYLTGIDVIGEYLTEINVTSPTGLVAADRLSGRTGNDRIAERFWHWIEQ